MNILEKIQFRQELLAGLGRLSREMLPLPGIDDPKAKEVLISQIIDSICRVKFVLEISRIRNSDLRTDPTNDIFCPLRAAAIYKDRGDIEEAIWLVFLATHFGKSKKSGWRLVKEVYGAIGADHIWSWNYMQGTDKNSFKDWYFNYYEMIKADKKDRVFSNHRKYESLKPNSRASSLYAITSYVDWINSYGTHSELFRIFDQESQGNSMLIFDSIYMNMNVARFGRMAKFDFLTMIGKLGIWDVEPGSAYLKGSSGPKQGCLKLFGNHSVIELERRLNILQHHLPLGKMGMQVLEDSICNWQKNPFRYERFSG